MTLHIPYAAGAAAGAPWPLSGTVVGALLNHRVDWQGLGAAADATPYKGRANAPVLQVKPRNTLRVDSGAGVHVHVPAGEPAVAVGASLAIVIGATACRVSAAQALGHVAGYTLAADICVPHPGPQEHYRPAVRHRARDGFCPLGPRIVPASAIPKPDALEIDVAIDGKPGHRAGTGERVRSVAQLIADVSAFMTLHAGDVLLLGTPPGAPRVAAGQKVVIALPAIGLLRLSFVPEPDGPAGAAA